MLSVIQCREFARSSKVDWAIGATWLSHLLLEVLDLETGREGLLQLLSFLLVRDDQGVQKAGAAHLW